MAFLKENKREIIRFFFSKKLKKLFTFNTEKFEVKIINKMLEPTYMETRTHKRFVALTKNYFFL